MVGDGTYGFTTSRRAAAAAELDQNGSARNHGHRNAVRTDEAALTPSRTPRPRRDQHDVAVARRQPRVSLTGSSTHRASGVVRLAARLGRERVDHLLSPDPRRAAGSPSTRSDKKLDATLLDVSFVGSNALAEELKELGVNGRTALGFTSSQHQATHKVWCTMIDESGGFKSIDME